MGVDVVIYVVIKFLGGYLDLLMGVVVVKDEVQCELLIMVRKFYGVTLGVLEVFLVMCGVRTLLVWFKAVIAIVVELVVRFDVYLVV